MQFTALWEIAFEMGRVDLSDLKSSSGSPVATSAAQLPNGCEGHSQLNDDPVFMPLLPTPLGLPSVSHILAYSTIY